MRENHSVVYLRNVALAIALGVSMETLPGCGSSELGTIKVPEDMKRKPSAGDGQAPTKERLPAVAQGSFQATPESRTRKARR